jgi:hypothetical protein
MTREGAGVGAGCVNVLMERGAGMGVVAKWC